MDFNGSFEILDKLTIKPDLTEESFKKSPLYQGQNMSLFFWVREGCYINGQKFIVGFYFKDEVISKIQLYCTDESLQDEEQRRKFNDKFVQDIAPQQKYEWGEIKSIFEARDKTSLIVVNYYTNKK